MLPAELFRQLRVTVRTLTKSPAFSATVIATLALGIGANTAVFSAVDAVLLKPLPYPEADRLVWIEQSRVNRPNEVVAPVRLVDWTRSATAFSSLTGYYTQDASELSGQLPERLKQAMVAPDFLRTLGISPALGRDFLDDERKIGGPGAVLISDRYWRRHFAADPTVVGRQLRFGTGSVTIIGVMPESFLFGDRDVDLWSPVFMDAPYAQDRTSTWFFVIGRLKPRVTLGQARSNLSAVQAALGRQHRPPDSEIVPVITMLKDSAIGDTPRSLWLVFGAVTILLLIACTNIASLLLARATRREYEVAVRYSLGATRASLVMQLLSEAFVLSLAGAGLGLALAAVTIRVLSKMAATLPRVDEIALDGRLLLYTLACAMATTMLCGLVPAWRGSRNQPREGLTHSGRTQVSGRGAMQWSLVGVQVALAVTLLAGSGLLLRSLWALGRVSTGFDAQNVLTFRMTASWGANGDWVRRARDVIETVPGVERAATLFASSPGVPNEFATEATVEGRDSGSRKILTSGRAVSSGYFPVMRIPLLQGELCRDLPAPSPLYESIVNRGFTRAFFPDGDPIGSIVNFGPNAGVSRIVGVVADSRDAGIDRAPVPMVYTCYGAGTPATVYLVRTKSEPAALAGAIRQALRKVEPLRSVYDVAPLSERIDGAFAENRLRTILLAFFAATAVGLASVGLYGTLSYFVGQRRREIGLRLALGAGRGRIVRQFMTRGLLMAALGCTAGLTLALAFTRVLSGMLFGVSPVDPWTLAAGVTFMLSVAALASLVPAARAAVLDPMKVLRDG